MAAGEGMLANGMKLEYSAAGSVWTELEDMDEIGAPGSPTANTVDVTPLRQTGRSRFKRRGLYDNGAFTFKQFYSSDRYAALQDIKDAADPYHWRVTAPDGAKWSFVGELSKCVPPVADDPETPLVIDCEVTVTGEITFTEAA
jgi:hypothetical protein